MSITRFWWQEIYTLSMTMIRMLMSLIMMHTASTEVYWQVFMSQNPLSWQLPVLLYLLIAAECSQYRSISRNHLHWRFLSYFAHKVLSIFEVIFTKNCTQVWQNEFVHVSVIFNETSLHGSRIFSTLHIFISSYITNTEWRAVFDVWEFFSKIWKWKSTEK